jgi:hypothetical protein
MPETKRGENGPDEAFFNVGERSSGKKRLKVTLQAVGFVDFTGGSLRCAGRWSEQC